MRRGSISSELLMCGGVRSILLLSLVARWLEIIDVCIWYMFVFMSAVVTVWGWWECFFTLTTLYRIRLLILTHVEKLHIAKLKLTI